MHTVRRPCIHSTPVYQLCALVDPELHVGGARAQVRHHQLVVPVPGEVRQGQARREGVDGGQRVLVSGQPAVARGAGGRHREAGQAAGRAHDCGGSEMRKEKCLHVLLSTSTFPSFFFARFV